MNILINTVWVLSALVVVAGLLLYVLPLLFKTAVDPRMIAVEQKLPLLDCGSCGYAGCKAFAEACLNSDTLYKVYCPVGGDALMSDLSELLGKKLKIEQKVAVLRCNGIVKHRPHLNHYDGAKSCSIASNLYGGETGCAYGCYGLGDCELACDFDALQVNPATGMPEIDEAKCTACGACVKSCPKVLIQLRKKGPKSKRIYVCCSNKDKGSVTKRVCTVGCIACGRCKSVCEFEAISIENNLAYIDDERCRLCRKCVDVCPTSAILELNFPAKRKSNARTTK